MGTVEPSTRSLPDGARIVVRCARVDDVARLMPFHRAMHDTSPHMIRAIDEIEADPSKHAEKIAEHTKDAGKLFLVACPEGSEDLIGDLSLRSGPFRSLAHRAEFGISVAQPWRGRGVGSSLISLMLDWAAAHPVIEKVALAVFANNPGAQRLYKRLGFVQEAVLSKHIRLRGEYVDDIQMAIWVKPGLAAAGFKTWPLRAGSLP